MEGAVYETAGSVLAGDSPKLSRYGVSDDDAFAVGLTCGGIIDVFVERVDRESFPGSGNWPTRWRPVSRWRWRP
nr:hypothetical protein [Actinopolyspora erythraea]